MLHSPSIHGQFNFPLFVNASFLQRHVRRTHDGLSKIVEAVIEMFAFFGSEIDWSRRGEGLFQHDLQTSVNKQLTSVSVKKKQDTSSEGKVNI